MTEPTYRVGIDTGGTFVDVAIVDRDGSIIGAKALAGNEHSATRALAQGAEALGLGARSPLFQSMKTAKGG